MIPQIITIDGPAGAGKSTTARRVAEALGFVYIDTGAMYRAVTLAVLRQGIELTDAAVTRLVQTLNVELHHGPDGQHTFLNGEDVSLHIRSAAVTNAVSAVSALPGVRRALVEIQRRIGRQGGVVMDGRDIGSVVFPEADVKIYLVADVDERVRRRLAEVQLRGEQVSEAVIRHQIVERDRLDSSRADSPLVRPQGAIDVDTTCLTIDAQVQRILDIVGEHRTV
ncbi:MAG: (d)CMP kinase [Candidatus Kapabacteria bacterium]|jgi:cytidylate kinase|nr:(d)CMP kinase [Candidatus Kapabacteria bacterium]